MVKFSMILLLFVSFAHAQNPNRGPCNTGRTPTTGPMYACSATTLVSPINPQDGGSIVDGNWQIASPYPSAPVGSAVPNPCVLSSAYVGAPVNIPDYAWYNPHDGISQWIGPNGGGSTPAGWYIYRTTFLVPDTYQGYSPSSVTITGQLLADNWVPVVFLQEVGTTSHVCNVATTFPAANQYNSWNSFTLTGSVAPATLEALYVLVYNQYSATPLENPTALRVEFQTLNYSPN